MRLIGMHLRMTTTLLDLAEKARVLNMDTFQCFLTDPLTNTLIKSNRSTIAAFVKLRREYCGPLYVHASYKTNLCNTEHTRLWLLKKEIDIARRLEFTHIVIHPGATRGSTMKIVGIDAMVRRLNSLIKYAPDVTIVLENTAHGSLSVGGDLEDFASVLQKIDHPEKIAFCIDTAHAYSYGYDLVADMPGFIEIIQRTIGLERITLLHVNDTSEKCGGKIDCHKNIGEGMLGESLLKTFALHPLLKHVPMITEPPVQCDEEATMQMMRSWHGGSV